MLHEDRADMQVLSVDSRNPDAAVMFVWDGTDALPLPFT